MVLVGWGVLFKRLLMWSPFHVHQTLFSLSFEKIFVWSFGHVCLDWMREENLNNLESALRSPFQAWIRVYRISVVEMKH